MELNALQTNLIRTNPFDGHFDLFIQQNPTIEQIVANCWDGAFLLWLAQHANIPIKELTLAKAKCARLKAHSMNGACLNAINCAELYGNGELHYVQKLHRALSTAKFDAYEYSRRKYARAVVIDANESAIAAADFKAIAYHAVRPGFTERGYFKEAAKIVKETIGELIVEYINRYFNNETCIYTSTNK